MPETKSEATLLYEAILERMEEMYETLVEAFTPPFLHETVNKATFRRNFYSMTPEQRAELIVRMGADNILEALGKRGTNHE